MTRILWVLTIIHSIAFLGYSQANPVAHPRRPSDFPQLPAQFRRELTKRGCLIADDSPLSLGKELARTTDSPKAAKSAEVPLSSGAASGGVCASNVVRGRFDTTGRFDWAALCSTSAETSVLLFWTDSGKTEELTKGPDRTGARDGYLRSVGKKFIMDHYRAYGGPKPPPIDHEGIEYGGEHVSTVLYFYRGKWISLQGAD